MDGPDRTGTKLMPVQDRSSTGIHCWFFKRILSSITPDNTVLMEPRHRKIIPTGTIKTSGGVRATIVTR